MTAENSTPNHNPQTHIHGDIKTGGGLVNTGTIRTNSGDFVVRDKVIIQQHLDPADLRNQHNHKALRQAVRRFWIDGVLKHSLYNEVLIRLGLDARPQAVDNRPWKLALHQHGQPDRAIADDIQIGEIFDKMGQQLLILGEPGSGKTTTLLTLADALLARADADMTLPTPVLFNLASWAEKQPQLEEWLSEELNTRYQIPQKIAKQWINDDELLLLLDGLDEVSEANRAACVTAINAFRQKHVVGLAVCSRTTEYGTLARQLRLCPSGPSALYAAFSEPHARILQVLAFSRVWHGQQPGARRVIWPCFTFYALWTLGSHPALATANACPTTRPHVATLVIYDNLHGNPSADMDINPLPVAGRCGAIALCRAWCG